MLCGRAATTSWWCSKLELLLGVLVHESLVWKTSRVGVVEVVVLRELILRGSGLRVVLGDVDLLNLGRGSHCDRFGRLVDERSLKADLRKKV
jgi:hypothetical protein